MKPTTAERRNGIQWTMWKQLDDLDFADDLVLLSHNHQHMQEETSGIETISARVGLRIHTGKNNLLIINTAQSCFGEMDWRKLKPSRTWVAL